MTTHVRVYLSLKVIVAYFLRYSANVVSNLCNLFQMHEAIVHQQVYYGFFPFRVVKSLFFQNRLSELAVDLISSVGVLSFQHNRLDSRKKNSKCL